MTAGRRVGAMVFAVAWAIVVVGASGAASAGAVPLPPVSVPVSPPTVTVPTVTVPTTTPMSIPGTTLVSVPVTVPTLPGGASPSPTPTPSTAPQATGISPHHETSAGATAPGSTAGGTSTRQPADHAISPDPDRIVRLRTAGAIGRLAARSVSTFAIPLAFAVTALAYLVLGSAGDDRSLTTAPVSADDDLLRFT